MFAKVPNPPVDPQRFLVHEERLPQVRLAQVLPLLAGPRHRRPVSLVLPRQVVQELQNMLYRYQTSLETPQRQYLEGLRGPGGELEGGAGGGEGQRHVVVSQGAVVLPLDLRHGVRC